MTSIRLAVLPSLIALVLVGCGGDSDGIHEQNPSSTEATAAAGPVDIATIQSCLEDGGHDVQQNTGTVGKSTGDLVVDSGDGVVYVFEDEEGASQGEAAVTEVVDYNAYRELDIEVVANTIITFVDEDQASELRSCVAG